MGIIKRENPTGYDYKPDDTDTKMYIDPNSDFESDKVTMAQIFFAIAKKWPRAGLEQIQITSEHIKIKNIYSRERYDSDEYIDYVVLTYEPKKEG